MIRSRHLPWLLAAITCGAALAHEAGSTRSAASVTDPRSSHSASMREREALLAQAERELARGDAASAIGVLDRAAMMLHAADTEMALVRAYLQAGEYRRALAFCAHTAGAHRETAEPSALYAWLLHLGGQSAFARRTLAEARARHPAHPSLAQTELQLESPATAGLLMAAPQPLAPYAAMQGEQLPPPPAARTLGGGVLVDSGRRALVPLETVRSARQLWVRNGLGQTAQAEVERRIDNLGLAVLRLPLPLDIGVPLQTAPRDPFAGSPGFLITFTKSPGAAPAWPWLQTGFHGAALGDASERRLGFELPAGSAGGLVLDAAGRFAGIALNGADGQSSMLPVSRLRIAAPEALVGLDDGPPTSKRMPADEAYERALRVALQVIVLPSRDPQASGSPGD